MMKRPPLTIGIEEEYQIIDRESGALKNSVNDFLDAETAGQEGLELKPELYQSTVEVGTKPCENIQEARAEILKLRHKVAGQAEKDGAAIAAAGTHPFSSWQTQTLTPKERYYHIVNDMQDLARELLIFGMHVHIGINDKEFAIDCMNVLRYFCPHILALSVSSPMWEGRNTGLMSYRIGLFNRFPRTGLPMDFSSYSAYTHYLQMMVKTKSIPDASNIYWDIRPHHTFPTLEFRICDLCTHVDDAICCAALFQALVLKHYKMRVDNITFRQYPLGMVEENKWRALRYGIQGKMIDFGRQEELSAKILLGELVEFVDDVLDELGSRKEVEHVHTILERGTSADRQLEVFGKNQAPNEVVQFLVAETLKGSAYV